MTTNQVSQDMASELARFRTQIDEMYEENIQLRLDRDRAELNDKLRRERARVAEARVAQLEAQRADQDWYCCDLRMENR